MPTNFAVWINESKAYPFVIEEAPYPKPRPGQVLIRNKAAAINPADYKIQAYDPFGSKYPLIVGLDVAGEVVEVGEGVTDLKPGQRVAG